MKKHILVSKAATGLDSAVLMWWRARRNGLGGRFLKLLPSPHSPLGTKATPAPPDGCWQKAVGAESCKVTETISKLGVGKGGKQGD